MWKRQSYSEAKDNKKKGGWREHKVIKLQLSFHWIKRYSLKIFLTRADDQCLEARFTGLEPNSCKQAGSAADAGWVVYGL